MARFSTYIIFTSVLCQLTGESNHTLPGSPDFLILLTNHRYLDGEDKRQLLELSLFWPLREGVTERLGWVSGDLCSDPDLLWVKWRMWMLPWTSESLCLFAFPPFEDKFSSKVIHLCVVHRRTLIKCLWIDLMIMYKNKVDGRNYLNLFS